MEFQCAIHHLLIHTDRSTGASAYRALLRGNNYVCRRCVNAVGAFSGRVR